MAEARTGLAIVIINYKTPDLVTQCLNSLLDQLESADARVVIVDNGSGDGSVTKIREWIAARDNAGRIQMIEYGANAGFSGGNNIGILSIDADYYLLLNSDTIVRPGALAFMLAAAADNPRAGMVSPRLEWPDGTPQESCFRYLSPVSEFIGAAQTGPVTALLGNYDVPLAVSDSIIKPQWTSFACVLLRREMVHEIGLMDEGFFLYFEDVEYCRRAFKAGWEIVHDPRAHVVHLRGGSSPVKKRAAERKRLPRYYYASRSRYFHGAYGRAGLALANVLWSLGRCVSKGREFVERRDRGAAEKQWLDIWTNWRDPGAPWSGDKRS